MAHGLLFAATQTNILHRNNELLQNTDYKSYHKADEAQNGSVDHPTRECVSIEIEIEKLNMIDLDN